MPTPYKWAYVIKAWADGKTVQYRSLLATGAKWQDHDGSNEGGCGMPHFTSPNLEWRVPVLHQEAWDHYAAGGDVRCLPVGSNSQGSLWAGARNSPANLTSDSWDNPMLKFIIVPKKEVVMAYCRRFEGGSLDVNLMPQLQHNLKLTFNQHGKLITAEVIG